MKKYLPIIVPVAALVFIVLAASFGNDNLKSSGGAPAGYTNSPGDGKNCSHCMGGTAVAVTDWITSNIPVTGYVPGSTYTITVTATGSGNKGFQVSPQDAAGNLIGTLTAGTGSKLVGSNKYVTHSSAQSASPTSWSFNWTAPSAGIGDVTFYGSVAVGKTNTKTTTLTVSQSTVGISDLSVIRMQAWPNPSTGPVNVAFRNPSEGRILLELFDMTGSRVATLMDEVRPAGEIRTEVRVNERSGQYLLRLTAAGATGTHKLSILD